MSPLISQPERTRTRPRRYAVGAMALLVTLPLAVGTVGSTVVGTATAAQAGRPLPERIGARPGVHQMITVTSANWQTSTATLRAWQRRADGSWRLARGPVRAVVGYSGWVQASKRVQATGTTPAGRFRLPYAFGRLADPGANLRYRHFDRNDWWPYEPRDPATYNVWQWRKATKTHWRANKAEHLWNYGDQYAYGVVIGFNLPSQIRYSHRRGQWVADRRADTARGGGIFLHVRGDGATAGCVAVGHGQLRWLIRWLRPGGHPQIVMGPYDYVIGL